MKLIRVIFVLVFALTIPLLLTAKDKQEGGADAKAAESDSTTDGIAWLSYAEASEKAAEDDQHVFIHFTTKWCGWCRKMERETYTDPRVIEMLNENFAPVQVWADSDDEVEIEGYFMSQKALAKQEFGVSSYPQYWFVSPEKTKVGPLKGYFPADNFMKALNFVKEYQYDTTRTSADSDSRGGKQSGK